MEGYATLMLDITELAERHGQDITNIANLDEIRI
jgi:hypothetical protein